MKKYLHIIPLACILIQAAPVPAKCQSPASSPQDSGINIQNVRLIQKLQVEVQRQQGEIQKAAQFQMVFNSIVKDMTTVSVTTDGEVRNEKIQKLLAQNASSATPTAKPSATPADADAGKFATTGALPDDMRADYDFLEQQRKQNLLVLQEARTTQATLEKLVNGLVDLADAGDSEARAIVDKYKIKRNPPGH